MMGKTHMLGGLAAGVGSVLATKYLFPDTRMEPVLESSFILCSTVSARLPDVDEKNSTVGRKLIAIPITLFILKVFLFLIEMVSIGSFRKKVKTTRKALNHRGIFHWLITWGILSILAAVAGLILYLCFRSTEYQAIIPLLLSVLTGFIIGYLSHIMLDLISGRIQLLAPFNKKYYGIRLIKSGSIVETILIRPALAAITGLLLYWTMK